MPLCAFAISRAMKTMSSSLARFSPRPGVGIKAKGVSAHGKLFEVILKLVKLLKEESKESVHFVSWRGAALYIIRCLGFLFLGLNHMYVDKRRPTVSAEEGYSVYGVSVACRPRMRLLTFPYCVTGSSTLIPFCPANLVRLAAPVGSNY